jgi:hypothetical protein
MRPWTLAPCLVTLRNQVNAIAPARLKASDGTIGDEAHAAQKSEHNPDAQGIVRAIDITQDPDDHDGDPSNDLDAGKLAAQLVASRDSRILYIIWNRRIARSYPKPGIPAWTWATYTGSDPHTNHVHLSVVPDSRANNTNPWRISATTTEEDPLSQITIEDIEKAAARGVLSAKLGSSGPTVAVAMQRTYGAVSVLVDDDRVDELADRVAAKLGGSADAATVRQALRDVLREGVQ